MIAPSQIQTQFAADFASVSSTLIQTYITQAYGVMNADVWQGNLDLGAMYLACHWMCVDGVPQQAGASTLPVGPTSSQSVSRVSESYAVAANGGKSINDLTDLNLSRYGLVFQRLKRGLWKGPRTDFDTGGFNGGLLL